MPTWCAQMEMPSWYAHRSLLNEARPSWEVFEAGVFLFVMPVQSGGNVRETVRRCLAFAVLATLLLPMVIAVVLGLGGLLASLGDQAGAAACRRVGLIVGAVWFIALAGTATASGIMALEGSGLRPEKSDSPPADHS